MKKIFCWMLTAILACGAMSSQAQVMKAADLEKYAKEKYGDKWLDAAANLAKELTLDKNESLSYQQVIEAPSSSPLLSMVSLTIQVPSTVMW